MGEPPHVPVDHENLSAKFWLNPVSLARNVGFAARELGTIARIVVEHEQEFLRAWHEYFTA